MFNKSKITLPVCVLAPERIPICRDPITERQMMSKGCIITSSARYLGSMKPFSVSVIGSLGNSISPHIVVAVQVAVSQLIGSEISTANPVPEMGV